METKEDLKNVGLVIVGSENGHFGERGNADYVSGKSAVQIGLVRSLMGEVVRVWPGPGELSAMYEYCNADPSRVNTVAPGPVDTAQFRKECAENPSQFWLDAEAATGLKGQFHQKVLQSTLFLVSENWSGSITGHVLNVDSGKQGKVMWMEEEC